MKYLFIFLLMFSISSGILTIISISFYISRYRNGLARPFIAYLLVFLILILTAAAAYLMDISSMNDGAVFFIVLSTARLCGTALACLGIIMTAVLLDINRSKRVKAALFAVNVLIIAVSLFFLLNSCFNDPYAVKKGVPDATDFLFYLVPFFCIISILVFNKRIGNRAIFHAIRNILLAGLFFIPLMFIENLNIILKVYVSNFKEIKFGFSVYPVFYLIFNMMILYYLIKNEMSGKGNDVKNPENGISENFMKKFKITLREKEIIELVIDGYNNKVIGEKLSISSMTVRNHLHNIFEKTNAANRTELSKIAKE